MFGDFITLTRIKWLTRQPRLITCRAALESSHGDAHDFGRNPALGRAAFAVAARLVQPRAGIESGFAPTPYDAKGLLKAAIPR